jgi:hypothetical protein
MGEQTRNLRVLGVRADTKRVYWAVVEGSKGHPVVVERDDATAPGTFNDAQALGWFRDRVHLIIDKYSPKVVAIRLPEPIAPGAGDGFRRRLRIEGVLMEAGHAKGLKVAHGALATIASLLGTKAREAKNYIDDGDLRGLDLTAMARPMREAVLVAVALLPGE